MQTRKKISFALIAIILALALTTCEDLGYTEEVVVPESEAPEITVQPVGGSFILNDPNNQPLTVTAVVTDGGSLSYTWYQATAAEYDQDGGTPVGTGQSYVITVLPKGVQTVYVVVTNTVAGGNPASTKSDLVRVIINDPNDAFYPVISAEPKSAAYAYPLVETIEALSVTATSSDSGTLTYQWYSSTTYSNEGGTLIPGQISASYTPEITEVRTDYYYVVIKNTNNNKTGDTFKELASSPAIIKSVSPNAFVALSATKRQYVRGFGAMANFWGNSPDVSLADYEKMFNPRQLGYNMLRVMIPVDADGGSTDMRVIMAKAVSNQLSGDKDRSMYYEIVKKVNKYKGFVLASPWSPPAEWKTNNSVNGGGAGQKANLKKNFLE